MHLAIKLLLWMVAGTGALLVALVALLLLVDVNLYRDRIEQHVSNALGREVILEGELGLEPSLRPVSYTHLTLPTNRVAGGWGGWGGGW